MEDDARDDDDDYEDDDDDDDDSAIQLTANGSSNGYEGINEMNSYPFSHISTDVQSDHLFVSSSSRSIRDLFEKSASFQESSFLQSSPEARTRQCTCSACLWTLSRTSVMFHNLPDIVKM